MEGADRDPFSITSGQLTEKGYVNAKVSIPELETRYGTCEAVSFRPSHVNLGSLFGCSRTYDPQYTTLTRRTTTRCNGIGCGSGAKAGLITCTACAAM